MKDFSRKIAVVTGAGTGMGRELALQLVSAGCDVAICDVLIDNMKETLAACKAAALEGTVVTAHKCDVSEEQQVIAFRDAVKEQHNTDHINLLFNNAGIGGGGSFVEEDRAIWDKTFGVCWGGVYFCTRAFLPMLMASTEGHIINTSSVNGFWACLGPDTEHTAYSAAKFAVKGFSEALQVDLRINAPHLKVSVVMPGHIGTSIGINSGKIHGSPKAEDMTPEQLAKSRDRLTRRGIAIEGITDDQLRAAIARQGIDFRDNAPVSSAEAATVILDGVKNEQWRILIGEDAHALDKLVREDPEHAYDHSFLLKLQEIAEWRLAAAGIPSDSEE